VTLVELVVVVLIVVTLSLLVVPNMAGVVEDAPDVATRGSMSTLRNAALGFLTDARRMPRTVTELFLRPTSPPLPPLLGVPPFDPATGLGWRGPYVATSTGVYALDKPTDPEPKNFTGAYGQEGDPACLDGWGSPIVVQVPDLHADGIDSEDERRVRLVSAGPDGVLDTPLLTPDVLPPGTAWFPSKEQCGDDLVHYLRVADLRPGTSP
jgi:type II secretory pathway pseudopilin PulG